MTTVPWDGTRLGDGPIALSVCEPGAVEGILLALSPSSPLGVEVGTAAVSTFLTTHDVHLFVSENVGREHQRLLDLLDGVGNRDAARDAVWDLTRQGRWVDIRLLDRQVRCGQDPNEIKTTSLAEIGRAIQEPQGQSDTPGSASLLRTLLRQFERLRTKAEQLAVEAAPVPEPKYVLGPLPPAMMAEMEAGVAAMCERVLARRRERGQPIRPYPGPPAAPPPPPPPADPAAALIGHQVHVRAAVSLGREDAPGLVVDTSRLPELLRAVEDNYRAACARLATPPEVRDSFTWDGDLIARDKKGFPVADGNRLSPWTRPRFERLCDRQNAPADVPRLRGGELSRNPEHWGFWAACDDTLWAWRQVYRMAEAARIAGPAEARPRYELVPTGRSLEPNLTVYRSLGVRVYRPRDGHVFLTGLVGDLRLRCLGAICARPPCDTEATRRLLRSVLCSRVPIVTIAGELYAGSTVDRSTRDEGFDPAHHFEGLVASNPEQARSWAWRVHALVDTAVLGLPGGLRSRLLQNDYGLERPGEADLDALDRSLPEPVESVLRSFLKDDTLDVVTSRLGLTANEGIKRFVTPFPHTSGAALRNEIDRGRWDAGTGGVTESTEATPTAPRSGRDLYRRRGLSLGGRPTASGASALVRRQEVLMSAEDVMLGVVHALSARGYRVLGLTNDQCGQHHEFVLEVPRADAAGQVDRVTDIAEAAAGDLLGTFTGPVCCGLAEAW